MSLVKKAILPAIVIASASLALYWVFLVPIFQAPDESGHLDYALDLYTAGRLITVREAPPAVGAHSYTRYLASSINFDGGKVESDYGTKEYFRDLDRNAPDQNTVHWTMQNQYLFLYPYGYYSVLAAWIKLIHLISPRLSVLFFGARVLSVILLMCSLPLAYAVMRELRFARGKAALLTGVIGFFPLTSFASSYVQPDNLSLTLALLCSYLALRLISTPSTARLALLGIALGCLCVTKYHFYVAVAVPVAGMLIAHRLTGRLRAFRWRNLVALATLPTLILGSAQIWVQWGRPMLDIPMADTQTLNSAAKLNYYLNAMAGAFANFYLTDGTTFQSFWGRFGMFDTPLIIVSPQIDDIIRFAIALLTVVIFGLTILRIGQLATRLIRVARRGHWRSGLAILFSNPIVNAYFIFTVMMFALYALYKNLVGQGRNWFPLILPIFLVAIDFAPRALSHRKAQSIFSRMIIAGLVAYSVVGSLYAVRCVTERFYGH